MSACMCGCGLPVEPKTRGRAAIYIHGHNRTSRVTPSLAERFSSRVQVADADACWLWTGGCDKDGRGRVWYNGRNIPAPRAALILVGINVPPGTMTCHHCDNPPCVNPSHLYVGTARSNVHDMLSRKRNRSNVPHPASRGELNHYAKLSDSDVLDIRMNYTGRRGDQTRLAGLYGVTPQLISLIVRGAHRV